MSVTIEHWRGAIGRFSGGRSGISHSVKLNSSQRQHKSSWCIVTAILLAGLILSPLFLVGLSYLPSNSFSNSNSKQSSDVQSPWGPAVQCIGCYASVLCCSSTVAHQTCTLNCEQCPALCQSLCMKLFQDNFDLVGAMSAVIGVDCSFN